MKKYAFLLALASACFAISCNKENPSIVVPEGMKYVTIKAKVTESNTKTSYTDAGVFSWTAGDKISVKCSDGNFYEFSADASGASCTFSGLVPTGVNPGEYAFFPADDNHEPTTPKYSIPENKDLTSHPSADIPMIGNKGNNDSYAFTHCCGAAKLTIANIPDDFKSLEITITSPSLKLSGQFNAFKSGDYWRWNPAATETASEKNFTRKVSVVNNKASIYVPYASGSDWWGKNTVSVTGYDSSDNPTVLVASKTMTNSIGTIERAHVKPLKAIGLNRLGHIDWTADGIPTFDGNNGDDHNYGERIIQWKVTSDSYYIYFYYKINKEKIKWNSDNNNYDSSSSRIYIGLDLDNDSSTGSNVSFADIPAEGWEAQIEVRPWSGTTNGSPEIITGENANSWIEQPVGTTLSEKVSQTGTFDSTYAYLEISIPRSALGDIASTIKARHGMQWGYYTSFESFAVSY